MIEFVYLQAIRLVRPSKPDEAERSQFDDAVVEVHVNPGILWDGV